MPDKATTSRVLLFVAVLCANANFVGQLRAQIQVRVGTDKSTPEEREAAVTADLQEAVQMIEDGHLALLMADFMSVELSLRPSQRGIGERDKVPFEELSVQLRSAMEAKPVFNRTRTLAQLDYILKPVEEIPEQPPRNVPDLLAKPSGDVSGFGPNFPTALFAAVGNLDAGRMDTFIRGMYPLPELARLTQGDQMERLKFRLTRNPEMLRLMVRDLKQAATATEVEKTESVNGSYETATVTLPQTSNGGKPRTMKFELVDGHWRFFDAQRETRAAHQKMMSAPIAGYSVPGSQLTLMLRWEIDCWRLMQFPVIRPVDPLD